MRLWAVLPAYNEAKNLGVIFDGFREVQSESRGLDLRIVLVDDGSTDGTPETARAAGEGLNLEVLVNERNLGLAETFMRGLTHAVRLAQDDDVIVCMDADGSLSCMDSLLRRYMIGNAVREPARCGG